MFFSVLFKNKKGNKEVVSKYLFNTAYILNVVGISLALLVLLYTCYINFKNYSKYITLAISIVVITYLLVLLLASLSTIINNDNKKEAIKVTKKKQK